MSDSVRCMKQELCLCPSSYVFRLVSVLSFSSLSSHPTMLVCVAFLTDVSNRCRLAFFFFLFFFRCTQFFPTPKTSLQLHLSRPVGVTATVTATQQCGVAAFFFLVHHHHCPFSSVIRRLISLILGLPSCFYHFLFLSHIPFGTFRDSRYIYVFRLFTTVSFQLSYRCVSALSAVSFCSPHISSLVSLVNRHQKAILVPTDAALHTPHISSQSHNPFSPIVAVDGGQRTSIIRAPSLPSPPCFSCPRFARFGCCLRVQTSP